MNQSPLDEQTGAPFSEEGAQGPKPEPDSSPRLPQFSLRGLMVATAGIALLSGALKALGVSPAGLAAVALVVVVAIAAAAGLAAAVASQDRK